MSEVSQNSGPQPKSLNECNSIKEIDFSKLELIRGQTPQDIEDKCLQLCKDYLSGNWTQQTVKTIEVRRVTGGFMNQLYYCAIKEPNYEENVPQEVAVRFYGHNIFDYCDKQRIRDAVISLVFDEKKVGPKIYAMFEQGQIIKYYKHRQFTNEEQKNPELVRKVFTTLAHIHSWSVPTKKDPWWFYDLTLRFYDIAYKKFPINQLIEENNCHTLKAYDLMKELVYLKGVMERSNSPIVFTHNDYRSSNLMITEPNDELIVCDYDISGYCFRGYEFIRLFSEWGRKQFEMRELEGLPFQDSIVKPLLEIYVQECELINGKSYLQNEINSVDHILKEVKIFLLFGNLFGTVWCLKMDEKDDDFPMNKKLCMEFAERAFKEYFLIKSILEEQNIIE